ncbi:MAG: glycoside hydrolase family 28 protein [Rubrobacteraceae bacterium]|nr:glycoside hydrolase family 28 protein [Rubrobacteraceae bacterium]
MLGRVGPPRFPNRDFVITDYGAVGDGKTDCTEAFRAAIADCSSAGGGRVIVPAGSFLTGAIHLKSNVNLHVTRDATVKFSQDPGDYLPVVYTRWQGIELMNYSPFIYAFEQENVAVTGSGVLDGQADDEHWWPWKGKTEYGWKPGEPNQEVDWDLLQRMADEGVPVRQRVFGSGHYLRPNFIQPYRCRNVLIEGVKILRSPMWEVHPVLSSNVTVRGIRVDSHGPNNDGCDPESCDYVLIDGCVFDTGDDCIAIKAGRNADGRRVNVPCQNVVIQHCHMRDGHGGVTIGSEMTGGVRSVFARNNRLSSPNLQIALRMKTNSVRGGFIENVNMKNCTVGQVSDSVFKIDFFYGEGAGGSYDPTVRDIDVRNVTAHESGDYALDLVGYGDDPIENVTLENCVFENAKEPYDIENAQVTLRNVTIDGKRYRRKVFSV